ncbi:hypothetical protein EDB92DRAFT_1969673 [Lactarius akahatsu]|uniref:Uncharacterized protein n=1 Tax=Lactarius akahatsu TaxID=416441 RepID=A0AAD4L8L3_9AGAM|nr:hypothetical protein EDB92DRAFT_1969673 [Lactarius akahatsu]
MAGFEAGTGPQTTISATTRPDHQTRRLEVGLCKQTLFSGLPHQPLPVPSIFPMDIMHLTTLNDPDLFLKLFTGKLNVYAPDNKSTWDWAIFYKNNALWNAHGETVVRAVPFLPSSFGRAPRDPAKKLNTGYKAWEFQQYLYGLGPTLFRHLLPRKYWLNFCKLVAGVRILQRHSIGYQDLLRSHQLLMDFAYEFEELYYQRMESRIHFVRQSVHLLTHIGPETFRAGPLACYAQWTLETAIGNLGREIRQDRDIFANLTQRAIIRAQVNALCARFPRIKFEVGGVSSQSNTREFEEAIGYVFKPRCEEYPSPLTEDEFAALKIYWNRQGWPNRDSWPNAICRWAKLQLPNGQMARSIWHESNITVKLRRTSCVEVGLLSSQIRFLVLIDTMQIIHNNSTRIGNVQFYFCIRFGDTRHPLAMISLFSPPDANILSDSSGTVYLCDPMTGPEGLLVVPVTSILSVVSMFPDMHVTQDGHISETGKFSLMRHAYIGLAHPSPMVVYFDDDDDTV